MRRVVVLHRGALGDFLMTLPLYEALMDIFEGIEVDFWTRPEYVDLIINKPYFRAACSCDGPELTKYYLETGWEEAPLPDPFLEAELILVFGQSSSRKLASKIASRVPAKVLWIQSFPTQGEDLSVTEFLFVQLEKGLGVRLVRRFPCVEPSRDDLAATRLWLSGHGLRDSSFAVAHPGSGGTAKIWPLSCWRALLEWLLERFSGQVAIVLGPAEGRLYPFARFMENLGCILVTGMSLAKLSALLALSRLYVGNDSGVTHLAAAVGTPTLAIFGPASPRMWQPRGRSVRVFESFWQPSNIFTWSESNTPLPPELASNIEDLVNPSRCKAFTEASE